MSERKDLRISIVKADLREMLLAEYLNSSARTKQLIMSSLMPHYLPLAMIKDGSVGDAEILESVRESVCQLRAQIDNILLAAEIHGLDVPERLYAYGTTSAVAPKVKQQTKGHRAKPKPIDDNEAEGETGDEQGSRFKAELYEFE